jgi:hypothetical protein
MILGNLGVYIGQGLVALHCFLEAAVVQPLGTSFKNVENFELYWLKT